MNFDFFFSKLFQVRLIIDKDWKDIRCVEITQKVYSFRNQPFGDFGKTFLSLNGYEGDRIITGTFVR